MKLTRILFPALLAAAILASCKKSSDDVTYNYLTGSMRFDLTMYSKPEVIYHIVPSGVTHPKGEDLGYYWRVSWKTVNDTTKKVNVAGDGSYNMTAPANVGYYTVKAAAFAPDYSETSKTADFIVVKEDIDSTVSQTGIKLTDPFMIDNRDARRYYLTTVGGKTWSKQNSAYQGSGKPYSNSEPMSYIFGRYYTWEEAKTACPSGWHLSTEQDWLNLAVAVTGSKTLEKFSTFPNMAGALMPDAKFLSERMWKYYPKVVKTNSTGFSAIPVGYAIESGSTLFSGSSMYATFWTADEANASQAWYRLLRDDNPDVLAGTADKASFRASVRCVQD